VFDRVRVPECPADESGSAAPASLRSVAEERDEPDLAARQAEIAAAMEETQRRQDEVQRRQEALLRQLERLDRAMDRKGED
jgi:hypothetical protein